MARRDGLSVGVLTLLSLLLVAGCGAAGSPGSGGDGPLGAALGRAREAGSYRFRSEVTQVVSPVVSVASAGRLASTQSLVLEGVTDVDASATELSVSADGAGESLGMRVVDGVWYRRDGAGSWVESSVGATDQVASAGDVMGYLAAARDVVVAGVQSSDGRVVTRYAFGIDSEAFAAMAVGQLQQAGRPVSGVSEGVSGSGELWVDGDGLPVRQLLSLEFPGGDRVGVTSTQISVDFSEFGTASVPGVARSSSSWWHVDSTADARAGWLLALSVLMVLLVIGVAGSRWLEWSVLSTRSVSMVVVVGLLAPLVASGRADAASPVGSSLAGVSSTLDAVVVDSIAGSDVARDVEGDVRAYQRSQLADPHLDRLASISSPALAAPQALAVPQLGDPTDTTTDTDADGLTDFVEERIGTDPDFADTDGDDVDDKAEVDGFTVPCSAITGAPVRWFGDPGDPDSNADGVADGNEWALDSDGDCTPDVFDDDNDGDGVPDRVDVAPSTVLGVGTAFDQAKPLKLTVNGLDSSDDLATFVEFQLRPTDDTQLKYAPHPDGSQSRLDWPADVDGQILDLNDGVNDGDVTLVPMLEISVPTAHALPAKADLDAFGIQVAAAESNDSRMVYVPLTLVRNPDSGADVALGGRMLYSSQADWSDAHDVKLLWLVQVNNDVPCDIGDPDAVANGCTDVGDPDVGYIYDSPQIVQAYYEPWMLTGLSVTEEHGADMAVIYEDPAAAEDDIVDYLPTWGLEQVLTERFLSTTPGTSTFEITTANIAASIDRDLNGGTTLYDLPNIFQVQVDSYRTFDEAMVKTASDVLPAVLADTFTPELGGGTFLPLITTAYTSSSRSFGLDAGIGYADVAANALTMVFPSGASALEGIPLETVGGVKWNPFCPTGGPAAWTPCTADALIADVDRQSASETVYDPDDIDGNDIVGDASDLAEGQRQLALVHAVTMMTGRFVTTQITTADDTVIALHESYQQPEGISYGLARGGQIVSGRGYKIFAGRQYGRTLAKLAEAMSDQAGNLTKYIGARAALESFAAPGRLISSIDEQAVTGRLSASLKRMSTGRAVGIVGVGLVAVLGVAVTAAVLDARDDGTSDGATVAGSLVTVVGLGSSLYFAVQATSQVLTVSKAVSQVNLARNLLGASSAKYLGQSGKAGVIGAVIFATITWGFFIYQMASAGVTAFSTEFNTVLAETLSATLYIALLTVLSLTVVGSLVVALIFLVDAIITAICELTDQTDCATVSSAVTDALTVVLFGTSPMVDVNASDLVSAKAPKITLTNPDLGLVAGNSATIALPVVTTITHTPPSAWQMEFYTWLYSKSNIRSGDFEYGISAPGDATQPAASGPGSWGSVTVADTYSGKDLYRATKSEIVEIDAADVVTFDTAGLNRSFPYSLNSAYTLPSYECWTVPGPPPFIIVPVCYTRTIDDTTSSDLPPLVYDILPATLSAFLTTTTTLRGEVKLAWDPAFEPMNDVDGDGLLATRHGGLDPDDSTVDADGDGITDRRELELRADGVAVVPVSADFDGDGLTDLDEVGYGTDPSVADSDNDGLDDGVEARHVVTADGVSRVEGGWDISVDGRTVRVYSDPLVRDSDFDGISDQAEKELAALADAAGRVDDELRPYHPGVVNSPPLGITMDVPVASAFVAAGDTLDVATSVTASIALAPSVLDVTWSGGPPAPPALLDFDPSTFVDEQIREQTTSFTVPGGFDEITVAAEVRAWRPTFGVPETSLVSQSGSAEFATNWFSGLYPRSADSTNQFVIAATIPDTTFQRVVRMNPLDFTERATLEADRGIGVSSSACNDDGTCLGVWSVSGALVARTVSASGNLSDPYTIATAADIGAPSVSSDGSNFAVAWTADGVGNFHRFDTLALPTPYPLSASSTPFITEYGALNGALELLWVRDRYVVIGAKTGSLPVNCLFAECPPDNSSTQFAAYDTTTGNDLVIGEFNTTDASSPRAHVSYDAASNSLVVVGMSTDAPSNSGGLGPVEGVLWRDFSAALNCTSACQPPIEATLFDAGARPDASFDPLTASWVVGADTAVGASVHYFGRTDLTAGSMWSGQVSASDQSVACPAPSAFPVVDVGFEELPGATTFADVAGQGLDAVADAATSPQAGAAGAPGATRSHLAARFADGSDVLTVPTPKLLGADVPVSVAFWVRVDPSASADPFVMSWDETRALRVYPGTGVVQWQWGSASVQSSTPINDAGWHFVVATRSRSGKLQLWVDGAGMAQAFGANSGGFPDELIVRGGGSPVTVDQLQFYNAALGDTAIGDLVSGVAPICLVLRRNIAGVTGGLWTTIASDTSDPRGGFLSASSALSLRVDRVAPTSSVVVPSAPIGAGVYMLAGSADDGLDGSGVALVEVRVDNGDWVAVDGAESWVLPLELSDGDHQIFTRATDVVGNVVTFGPDVLRVDLTAPVVTLDAVAAAMAPVTDESTGEVSVTVSGTASDPVSGLSGDRVEVRVVPVDAGDAPDAWHQAAVINGVWSIDYVLSPTPRDISGISSVSVRAVDAVGNATGDDAASATLVLDSVAPMASLSAANRLLGVFAGAAVLSGTVSDNGGVGVASVEVSFTPLETVVDPSFDQTTRVWLPAQVVSSSWSLPVPADLEGMFQIDVRSTDSLGNVSIADRVWSGIVDTRAPRLTLTVEPTGRGRGLPVQKFEVAYECVANDLFLDVASFDCPGTSVQPVVRGFLEPSLLRDALDVLFPAQAFVTEVSSSYTKWEGTRPSAVRFGACDAFGNCAEAVGAVQQVLRLAGLLVEAGAGAAALTGLDPNAVVVSPTDGEHVAAATTSGVEVDVVVAVEAPESIKTIDVLIDGDVVAARSFVEGDRVRHDETITVDVVDAGWHTVSVSVVDHIGGVDVSVPFSFFADADVPVLSFDSTMIGEGQTWTPGSDIYEFAGGVVDDGTVALVQIKVADGVWRDTIFGSGVWKVAVQVPGADGTVLPVRVRAYDLAGRFAEIASTSSVETAPAGAQPYVRVGTVISDGPDVATGATSATFTFAGIDGDSEVATFVCRLDEYQPTGCESPLVIDDLAAGSHTFTVTAIDADGYADLSAATWSWTVTASGPQPDLAKRPPLSTPQRSAVFEFVSASGATFECALDTVVFEACASPVQFDGVARGNHTFMVRATVNAVTGTAVSATWTVVDEAPVAYGQEVLVTANDALGQAIKLVADDVDDLTYRVVDEPEFGFLEGTAPDVTYIAFADFAGPDSFSFLADDGQNVSEVAVVEVLVTTRANAPVIEIPAAVVTATAAPGAAHAIVEYVVSATDADTIATPGTLRALFGVPVVVTCAPASGTRFVIGDTTVTCAATDVDLNTATATFIVRVIDDQRPVLGAVSDQAVTIAQSGDPVEFAEPGATDNSGVVTVACNPTSGSRLPVGASTVTCAASDAWGNTATAAFVVTVSTDAAGPGGTLPVATEPVSTQPTSPSGYLPETGNGGLPLRQALLLIMAGLALVLIARRRRGHQRTSS